MTALILVAAGSGQRLGAGIPKALVRVGGDTLIGHCLRTAATVPDITAVVVVAPAADVSPVRVAHPDVRVVAGGDTRDASVRHGLDALPPEIHHVLIHDAARPFTPAAVFTRVIDALHQGEAAVIPAVAVADTIKQVQGGHVVRTPDRSELVAVQTPQGFEVAQLRAAHVARDRDVTDDAMMLERAGVPVRVVEGAPEAFKITTAFDLAVARAMKEQ